MVPLMTSLRGMEDHFHAAVLLGFEGLVKIRAVSEIHAAVGDEEGGVSLLDFWIGDVIAANIVRPVPAQRLHGMGLGDFDEVEMGVQGEKIRPAATMVAWGFRLGASSHATIDASGLDATSPKI
jgi:hypothetical protein